MKKYPVKGFTMDDARLKNLSGGSCWKELLDRIRDIRSRKRCFTGVVKLFAWENGLQMVSSASADHQNG